MAGNLTKPVVKKEATKRSRAFSTRAKTGCKTCKVRHVKCDEARPGCRKCAQTGRQCDGYAHCTPSPSNKTSTITYSIIPKSLSDVAYRLPPTIPDFLPPSLSASDQEHHSFRFFHAQTAPQLGSFFGSKFWNHFVLKASHHEPAVRHAAIALGSLHERFELKDVFVPRINEDAEENSFALQQYVKAINCLVRPDMSADNKHTHRSANVALTTCILFICFETLRGHYDSALAHIDGGVRILSEIQSMGDTTPVQEFADTHIPMSIFRVLFRRLDIKNSVLSSRARFFDGKSGKFPNPIPETFLGVEEAREALESVWIPSARSLLSCSMYNGIPLPLLFNQETKLLLLASLESWSRAFESYSCRTSNEAFDPMEERARNILRLHKIMTQILVTTSTAGCLEFHKSNELLGDNFRLEFEAMVALAAKIGHASLDIQTGSHKAPFFTLDNEILQPLFLVATNCHHRRTRNKAILLLKRANRQEGVWNSLVCARMAQKIRAIEETGLDESIEVVPGANRLRNINMKFEFDGFHRGRAWLAFQYNGFPSAHDGEECIQLHEEDTSSGASSWSQSPVQDYNVPTIGVTDREPSFDSEWRVSIVSESP